MVSKFETNWTRDSRNRCAQNDVCTLQNITCKAESRTYAKSSLAENLEGFIAFLRIVVVTVAVVAAIVVVIVIVIVIVIIVVIVIVVVVVVVVQARCQALEHFCYFLVRRVVSLVTVHAQPLRSLLVTVRWTDRRKESIAYRVACNYNSLFDLRTVD